MILCDIALIIYDIALIIHDISLVIHDISLVIHDISDTCNMDLDTNSLVSGGRVARPKGSSNEFCDYHFHQPDHV